MVTEDSYICDVCGDEYSFENSYSTYFSNLSGETYYLIDGWYGGYDGQDMCECCWDRY